MWGELHETAPLEYHRPLSSGVSEHSVGKEPGRLHFPLPSLTPVSHQTLFFTYQIFLTPGSRVPWTHSE